MNYKNLLRIAYRAAYKSTDISTKNGALLVNPITGLIVAEGFNSHVGVTDHERPRKYQVTEHAERAAIYEAARQGIATRGLILVCPWASCADCARGIVLAGISLVVAHQQVYDKTPERWREEIVTGLEILRAGNVAYHLFDGDIGNVENLFDKEIWLP